VQLYVGDPIAKVSRPPKELKAFKKINLAPGETKTVAFMLDKEALSFYDVDTKAWVAEPGEFKIMLGSSSRDIRVSGKFELIKE